MCGRYALYGPISRHRKNEPVDDLPDWYRGCRRDQRARPMRFNVAPTDVMPIVGVNREGGISIRELRWGLVPYWAKGYLKIGYKAINARGDGRREADVSGGVQASALSRAGEQLLRVEAGGSAKQPYFIHDPDGELLMFAGL